MRRDRGRTDRRSLFFVGRYGAFADCHFADGCISGVSFVQPLSGAGVCGRLRIGVRRFFAWNALTSALFRPDGFYRKSCTVVYFCVPIDGSDLFDPAACCAWKKSVCCRSCTSAPSNLCGRSFTTGMLCDLDERYFEPWHRRRSSDLGGSVGVCFDRLCDRNVGAFAYPRVYREKYSVKNALCL